MAIMRMVKQTSSGSAKSWLWFFGALLCLVCLLALPVATMAEEFKDNWTGPYIGLTVGASGSAAVIEDGAGDDDLDLGGGGASFGIVGGYNFAPFGRTSNGQWLIGVEADLQTLDGEEKDSDPVIGLAKLDSSWLASTRVRAGYAWERVFLYGTAGLALSDIHVDTVGKNDDDIRLGFGVGAGAEMAINENWSGRLEGIVYGFGEESRRISGVNHDIGMGAALLRLGISRRF